MGALEDWYMVGQYEDVELLKHQEEEDAALDIIRAKIKDIVEENKSLQVNTICPMQLISQINEDLSKESPLFGQVLYIKGVFKYGNNVLYNNYYYDFLKDENSSAQVKILIPDIIRQKIKPDSLMIFCGMITKRIDSIRSSIEIQFRVDSIVEEVKSQAIDQDDLRRIELRQRKVASGFRNVDSILENMLLNNQRPKIALVIAQNAIVLKDFEDGKRDASVEIDFVEEREVFTRTDLLCKKLRQLDQQGYSAIALVRGGGINPKTDVDKPEVIETVIGMKTPVISGLGHQPENIFLRQVADKWEPTPQGLGQYFADLVRKAIEKRNNSKAVLEASVKRQYQGLLDAEKKRNTDLQNQIQKLTRTYEDTTSKMKEAHMLSVKALENKLSTARRNNTSIYIIIALIALIIGFILAFVFIRNNYLVI